MNNLLQILSWVFVVLIATIAILSNNYTISFGNGLGDMIYIIVSGFMALTGTVFFTHQKNKAKSGRFD